MPCLSFISGKNSNKPKYTTEKLPSCMKTTSYRKSTLMYAMKSQKTEVILNVVRKAKQVKKDEAKFEKALVEETRSYPCIWNTYSKSYKEQQKKQFAWFLTESKLRKEGKLYTQVCIWFGWMFTGVERRTMLHLIWESLERYFATVSKMAAVFCMKINFMKPIVYSNKTVAELLNRPLVQNWLYVIQPTEKLSPRGCSNWFNPFMLGGNKSSYYSKPAALSCWFV